MSNILSFSGVVLREKFPNVERYYPLTSDFVCKERCYVRHDEGVMIGSVTCTTCQFNLEHGVNDSNDIVWVKCENLNEAKRR